MSLQIVIYIYIVYFSIFIKESNLIVWIFLVCNTVVKLNANRMVVGTLRGFDQFMNLVVDNTVEVNGNEKTDIGMVVSLLISFFTPCF